LPEALQLYNALTARDIPFPMEWEERVLQLCIADDPERPDTLQRYRHVLRSLGKPVPLEVEDRCAALAKVTEYGTDHQQSASQYHQKTGLDDTEPEFRELADRVRPFTMTSFERMYALFNAIAFIEAANVPGDIVECGVWRGGSMMLAAHRLLKLESLNRHLFLFDTYEGLPRPDEALDVDIWGNRAIDGWLPQRTSDEGSYWANASLDEVRSNLMTTGYPPEQMHFIKGMVEDTIPGSAPDQIALLRLDTDWYASTRHEMRHLFPRLAHNGVLIIDDYGHFAGARRAVDEYFAANPHPILLHRVDYSGRIAIKVART
jgi:hypothetical protein